MLNTRQQKKSPETYFCLVQNDFFLLLRRVSPARPAPVELPQGRKTARVDGCSGAM